MRRRRSARRNTGSGRARAAGSRSPGIADGAARRAGRKRHDDCGRGRGHAEGVGRRSVRASASGARRRAGSERREHAHGDRPKSPNAIGAREDRARSIGRTPEDSVTLPAGAVGDRERQLTRSLDGRHGDWALDVLARPEGLGRARTTTPEPPKLRRVAAPACVQPSELSLRC